MNDVLLDIRLAFRRLLKSPSFTVTALLTLAVGIGANLVVFGVLNGLLLTPLAVPEPDQLYSVQHQHSLNSSYLNYRDIRDRNSVFSGLALMRVARVGFETGNAVFPAWGYEVSGNYFTTLGVQPYLGRFISPEDEKGTHADPVTVLSYASWQERFHEDPNVIGRMVHINKHVYTIIGVAPKSFHGTEHVYWPELWLPALNEEDVEGFNWIEQRDAANCWVVARLKTGVSKQRAEAELNRIAGQLARDYPNSDETPDYHLSKPGLHGDSIGGPVRGLFAGIMFLASLVLLAVCTNIGALFAARTSDRSGEFALRLALGSSRMRIFRQLLMESIVVSLLGCGIAMVCAQILLQGLSRWRPLTDFPIQFIVRPDWSVYLFGFLVALITGLLFGSMSARRVWQTDPNQNIRKVKDNTIGSSRLSVRDVLLGVQITLCCLLVTASIVALKGLQKAASSPLGFDTAGVYVASLDLRLANYKDAEVPGLQKRLQQAAAEQPGITAAAFGNSCPLTIDQPNTTIAPETTAGFGAFTRSGLTEKFESTYYQISPGYIDVTGMHLIAGRDFTWRDADKAPRVAIVSRSFAKQLYGSEQALGKRFFSQGQGPEPWQIIGIVEDGRYQTFRQYSLAVFFPILEEPSNSTVLLAHTSLPTRQAISEMKIAIAGVDSSIPLLGMASWNDSVPLMLFPARALTAVLGVFGVIAMVVAITGIFGLSAQTVSRRLRDLGIRLALGAQPFHIIRVVLLRTTTLLAVGSCLGFLFGYAVSKVIASVIYQASASDPVVVLTVIGTMFLVGGLATSIPLRRALSIRPIELLRSE